MSNAAPPSTSIDLLGRLKRNPRSAGGWEAFNSVYGPLIESWCRNRGLAEADVEDVAQDVRLKLISAIERFDYDPSRTFRGWLRTMVGTTVADHRRRWNRSVRGSGDSETERVIQQQSDRVDRRKAICESLDLELLEQAMASVKGRVAEHNWRAFLLSAIEGHPVEEVANELGIPSGMIYVARSRIQKMISREIQRLMSSVGD